MKAASSRHEGLIDRKNFTAMYGMVGLAECVNILMEKEGRDCRFGHSKEADQLGVEIMGSDRCIQSGAFQSLL